MSIRRYVIGRKKRKNDRWKRKAVETRREGNICKKYREKM